MQLLELLVPVATYLYWFLKHFTKIYSYIYFKNFCIKHQLIWNFDKHIEMALHKLIRKYSYQRSVCHAIFVVKNAWQQRREYIEIMQYKISTNNDIKRLHDVSEAIT